MALPATLIRSKIPTRTEEKNPNNLILIISLGLAGIAIWKGINYFKEKQSQKEIEKAQAGSLKHELNLKRTQQKIAEIERRAIVSGMNSYKKNVSVNIINQAKEIINSLFLVLTDKNGNVKYHPRPSNQINVTNVRHAVFSTPLKSIGLLQKVYNIYTGRNLLTDAQKLPLKTYTEIKTIFTLAQQKYK